MPFKEYEPVMATDAKGNRYIDQAWVARRGTGVDVKTLCLLYEPQASTLHVVFLSGDQGQRWIHVKEGAVPEMRIDGYTPLFNETGRFIGKEQTWGISVIREFQRSVTSSKKLPAHVKELFKQAFAFREPGSRYGDLLDRLRKQRQSTV